jgi:hypothetical protein
MSATELWVNNDGMEVRFGSEKAAVSKGGNMVAGDGNLHEVRATITGTNVPAADAPIDKKVALPVGAYIEEAILYVKTAFTSGGSATLDIGLMNDDGDGTFSTLDDNGIDAAIALTAIDAIDDRIATDGAQINTSPANSTNAALPMVISYGYNTAAFTAGEADLVIRYRLV